MTARRYFVTIETDGAATDAEMLDDLHYLIKDAANKYVGEPDRPLGGAVVTVEQVTTGFTVYADIGVLVLCDVCRHDIAADMLVDTDHLCDVSLAELNQRAAAHRCAVTS